MPLPAPAASRAVLIGSSEYETLEPIPAVANNLTRLAGLLSDPDLWGLPPEHVTVLHNPASRDDVLEAVHRAAAEAEEAILVYFAGHGLTEHPNFALHLALPAAGSDRLFRALPYVELRREIGQCQARHKVVILDCCYSGRAMDGYMSASLEVADQAQIEGTYLMTASAETSPALAPPGEEFTAFTGELIRAAEQGVEQGPDLLDMGTLYFQIRASLMAKNRPEPQERARNDGRSIALLRNRRGAGGPAAATAGRDDVYRRPTVPAGYEDLLRRPPREVLERVRSLRDEEQTEVAEQLLGAVIGHRGPEETAATLRLLARAEREADSAVALRAAASRPADEVGALLSTLRELQEPAIVQALLSVVALSPAAQVVAVSTLLNADARPEESRALLDAASAERPGITATIELIAALWAAHRADEIDRVLAAVASRITPEETLELADALRTTGREETAFGLYLRASTTLARRAPDQIASVVHAMHASGQEEEARQLVDDAVRARNTAGDVMQLAEAFWGAGHDDLAVGAVESSALLIPEDDVIALLEMLYSSDHSEAVDGYCKSAFTRQSPTLFVMLIDILNDLGRPLAANRLLTSLGNEAPESAVETIRALVAAGREQELTTVVGSVLRAKPEHQARFIAVWGFGSEGQEVVGGLELALHGFVQRAFPASASLVPLLMADISPDERRTRLLAQLFPDAAAALAGFEAICRFSWCESIATTLLDTLQTRVDDFDTAVKVAVVLVEAERTHPIVWPAPAKLRALDQPGPLAPDLMLAVARCIVQGTGAWRTTEEEQTIGMQLLDERLVALVAALVTQHVPRASMLLQIIAQYRPVEALPAIIIALTTAGLIAEQRDLLKMIWGRPKKDVRLLTRLLTDAGRPDLAARLQGFD